MHSVFLFGGETERVRTSADVMRNIVCKRRVARGNHRGNDGKGRGVGSGPFAAEYAPGPDCAVGSSVRGLNSEATDAG